MILGVTQMIKTSVKNNIKSIIRDPTVILAFLAAIILQFIDGVYSYVDGDWNAIDREVYLSEEAFSYMMNTMVGMIFVVIQEILFPFIGIVIALDIFKDKRSNAYDLVESSQISFRKYYWSKLISYYIVSVVLCLTVTALYACVYAMINIPPNADIDWGTVLLAQAVAVVVLYTGCLLVPIAIAVFLSALTGKPIVGIVVNCVYRFIQHMFVGFSLTDFAHYVYVYPTSLYLYLTDWPEYPPEQRFSFDFQPSYGMGDYTFHTNFGEALYSHVLQILIATVLLTTSYFLLKRRFQRS